MPTSARRSEYTTSGEIVTAAIERVGADGDGVAAGPVFVPFALPGERILVRKIGDRGQIVEIIEASCDRVTPPCPHFGECGGCALQHWRAAPYLAWKSGRIKDVLGRAGLATEILPAVAVPTASRRRLALHARRRQGEVVLGFKARRSWRLTPIETCVISDPAIVAALPALRAAARFLLEHPQSAPTLHVTWTLTGLDVDVTGLKAGRHGLSADGRERLASVAETADFARVTLAGETIYQSRTAQVRLGEATVALPPGAFLQASQQAEAAMADFVSREAMGAKAIADLYCGVGTFTFSLARLAPVLAADASAPAIAALTAAVATASGAKPISACVRDLERRPFSAAELKDIDVAVLDPPRAGASAQSEALARSKVSKVIAVSCNPTTFARDAATLAAAGFTLERVLPVDQFLWSPHIELVGVLTR